MVKNKMPEGWENYTAIGDKVMGTCFLPFKVPLKEAILQRSPVSEDEWFTPSILLQKVPNLKLVIDLTNTDRYYNTEEITENGIFHTKIKCPGGGTLPHPRFLYRFYSAVDNFIAEYGNDHLIGVHCTHGLNRTGYFVCKYMVTRMGILPEKAIKDFQMARGHTMNRPVLINDILNIYGTTSELRVDNYFNTLNISEKNKNRFHRNYRQGDERNREMVNWRIKYPNDTSNSFRSWQRNEPQTSKQYEKNRKNFRNSNFSTYNPSWQKSGRRGDVGGENDRGNVVRSFREQQGRKEKAQKRERSFSNKCFYSQEASTRGGNNDGECSTINDEGDFRKPKKYYKKKNRREMDDEKCSSVDFESYTSKE